MRWGRYGLMLLLGVLIGQGLIRLGDSQSKRGGHQTRREEPQNPGAGRKRSGATGIDGILRSEMGISEKGFSFEATTKRLHDQPLSPQRTRAMLAFGIQAREGKQLMEDFVKGEIGSLELDAVVRRLATEDPDEMWRLSSTSKISVGSWEDFMTIQNAIIQTLAQSDAPAVTDRLNAMEPSRHRLFIADLFKSYWAEHDPAAAAMGFDEAAKLSSSGNSFAEQIVRSWNSKDPSAMAAYIEQLPAGSTRQLFEKAHGKLQKK
jgi:hypothetical protein